MEAEDKAEIFCAFWLLFFSFVMTNMRRVVCELLSITTPNRHTVFVRGHITRKKKQKSPSAKPRRTCAAETQETQGLQLPETQRRWLGSLTEPFVKGLNLKL